MALTLKEEYHLNGKLNNEQIEYLIDMEERYEALWEAVMHFGNTWMMCEEMEKELDAILEEFEYEE